MLNQKWAGAVDAYRKNLDPKRRQMVEALRAKNEMGYNPEGGIAEAVYSKPLAGEPMGPSISSRMSPGGFDKVFGTGKVMPPTGLTIQKESVSVMPAKKQSNLDKAISNNSDIWGKDNYSDEDLGDVPEDVFGEEKEDSLDSLMGKINQPDRSGMESPHEIDEEVKNFASGMLGKGSVMASMPKMQKISDLMNKLGGVAHAGISGMGKPRSDVADMRPPPELPELDPNSDEDTMKAAREVLRENGMPEAGAWSGPADVINAIPGRRRKEIINQIYRKLALSNRGAQNIPYKEIVGE